MNLSQFNTIATYLATIASCHGNLPSLRKMAIGEYNNVVERSNLLDSLEAELRLLSNGYEPGASNGSTFKTRVTAAQDAVAILDAMPDRALSRVVVKRSEFMALVRDTALLWEQHKPRGLMPQWQQDLLSALREVADPDWGRLQATVTIAWETDPGRRIPR